MDSQAKSWEWCKTQALLPPVPEGQERAGGSGEEAGLGDGGRELGGPPGGGEGRVAVGRRIWVGFGEVRWSPG